jgi:predicted phage tail protein
MMRTVRLHGRLREFEILYAPNGFRFDVNTPVEAARAIACQVPGFDAALREGYYRVRIGPQGRGGKTVKEDHIRQRLGDYSEIHITPVGSGAAMKSGTKKIVTGIAILGLALGGGVVAGGAAGLGAGLGAAGRLD